MKSNLFPINSCIELYNASSNDILKCWKMKGKIIKEFEPYSKSYIHTLLIGGTSIMTLPNKEKEFLQIPNPFLLFQFVLINPKNFNIELNIRDINNNNKKMKIPINNYQLNIWTNLLIDIGTIFHQVYQNTFKYIDKILITGNIKIRKIYSLKTKDELLPNSLDLGKHINVESYFLFDYNLTYVKFNLNINDQQNRKDNKTPIKRVRQISPLRIEIKNNLNSNNEKTKKNIKFAKKIPDLTRLKNEINYGLIIKQNGIGSIRNVNKILGFEMIENLETYNDVKTPIKNLNRNKEDSSKLRQKSYGKYNYKREIGNKSPKNKLINPIYRNKYNNYEPKKDLYNEANNINNNKSINKENNFQQNDIDNAIKNINKIAFHNDTLYNFGNRANEQNEPKYISYGIPIQSSINKKKPNSKTNDETKLQKAEENNLQLPIIKNNIPQKNNNLIENNNNKYGNIEIMLDSALLNNSRVQAQLYDSIEEESCLINNNINSTLIDGSKMEDKIIKIDPDYKKGILKEIKNNKNESNISNNDFPDLSNLINDDSNNSDRPYTPPLAKLVPLNQSRNIKQNNIFSDEKTMPKINNNNPNNISYVKILKKPDNLIYDEMKGCYYNPRTNIYYDIKNLF